MPTDTSARTSPWTPERDERLRTLWLDGKSATEIAWTFGGNITRNSVIGRVHRLKLNELRPRPVAKPKPVGRGNPGQPKVNGIAARAEKRQRSVALAMNQHARNTTFREGVLPPEDDGVDVGHLIGIEQLQSGIITQCRFIHGEPGAHARYCGKPVKAGSSWCPDHYARVFGGRPGIDD